METNAGSGEPWHICDDFLDPAAEHFDGLSAQLVDTIEGSAASLVAVRAYGQSYRIAGQDASVEAKGEPAPITSRDLTWKLSQLGGLFAIEFLRIRISSNYGDNIEGAVRHVVEEWDDLLAEGRLWQELLRLSARFRAASTILRAQIEHREPPKGAAKPSTSDLADCIFAVLRELKPGERLTGEQIAERLEKDGFSYNSHLRAQLATMVKTGEIINHKPGYSLP